MDDREVGAHVFLQPRDWTGDDDGCLVVEDAAGRTKRILPKSARRRFLFFRPLRTRLSRRGGRLVVYLARLVVVEHRPARRRPRLSLVAFFGRRDPDMKLEDSDSGDSDDDDALPPERRAADLAEKLRKERGDAAFVPEVDGAVPSYSDGDYRDVDLTGRVHTGAPLDGADLV